MDADEFARFGAVHDLVARMSAQLGLQRQADRGAFYRHATAHNLVDQLEAIRQLRAALDQAEAFSLFGLRIGTPGTPEVADDTIAEALGITREQAQQRIEQARQMTMAVRTPDDYVPGKPGTDMAGYLAALPDPVE